MRIDATSLASTHQRIEHSEVLSSVLIMGKEVVFPSQGKWADFIFNQIVIDFQLSITSIETEPRPSAVSIGNGFTNWTFGKLSIQVFL